MGADASEVAEGDHRGPLEVGHEGVLALRDAHQRNPGGGADRQQAAADPAGERDQQPLETRHLRAHAEDREHHRDVVDDRRNQAKFRTF